jgi:hypothetical protein
MSVVINENLGVVLERGRSSVRPLFFFLATAIASWSWLAEGFDIFFAAARNRFQEITSRLGQSLRPISKVGITTALQQA